MNEGDWKPARRLSVEDHVNLTKAQLLAEMSAEYLQRINLSETTRAPEGCDECGAKPGEPCTLICSKRHERRAI